jgi:hypothetical protein
LKNSFVVKFLVKDDEVTGHDEGLIRVTVFIELGFIEFDEFGKRFLADFHAAIEARQ